MTHGPCCDVAYTVPIMLDDSPATKDPDAAIAAALRRGDGAAAAAIMDAHHDLSERRITAWVERQADGAAPASAGAVRAAVQAALLWPGPG